MIPAIAHERAERLPGMPIPARFCAWEECKRVFRPGRTDQECCTVACEKRRKRALHPSTKPSKARYARQCAAPGCVIIVHTDADFCSEHSGSRHGRAPVVVARVETAAATAMECPKCGGPVRRDGVLVSCLDRAEDRPDACGWVELARRAVRAGEGRGVRA